MSAKKLIAKVKTLHKKVVKEIRKKKPDFTAIGQHITAQTLLVSNYRDKVNKKIISTVKPKKIVVAKKKKAASKKPAKKK